MAKKMYRVLEGQRYAGKYGVRYGKGEMGRSEGEIFSEDELFKNEGNLEMSLNGADDKMDRYVIGKDEKGKNILGDEFVSIIGKAPKIELIKAPEKKGKKK